MIRAAQRLGFTLDEVAELLETAIHHRGPADTVLAERAKLKLIEVDERIADLTVIRTALEQTIEADCSDLIECAQAGFCPLPFLQLARPDQPEITP